MASRPWVEPGDVREYSNSPSVIGRKDSQLIVDISRAEQWVITYTHNLFGDDYEAVPDAVRNAVIILADFYAQSAINTSRNVSSESFDDYSYTASDGQTDINSLGLSTLLDGYIIDDGGAGGKLKMRLRKL